MAQDVIIDLTTLSPTTGSTVTGEKNGVAYTFEQATSPNTGAYLWNAASYCDMTLSSSQKMAVVELVGRGNQRDTSRPTEIYVVNGGGKLVHNPNAVSVWTAEESAGTKLVLNAASGSTYTVQKVRVWYDGTEYIPGGTDTETDESELTGTPLVRTLSLPQHGVAVKMAIVTVKQFKSAAQDYALWKTQQGYDVEEVYVEDCDPSGKLKGVELATAIQTRLKEVGPAFVLIMGDDYHVPPFKGTYPTTTPYATDYFYGEYTGDNYPEAYVGRFSADTEADLRVQMYKTQYMSKLSNASGKWLDTSVVLQSEIMKEGYEYTANYIQNHCGSMVQKKTYFNGETLNSLINQGSAMVTYFGHGSWNGLGSGLYNTYNASTLANTDKYPLMLAITCLTGQFDDRSVPCLAETMQRRDKAGTVAFVGATRESFDTPNLKFMMGGNREGQSYLGFMASMFPYADEDPLNQHARTLGEAVAIGAYSVNAYVEKYVSVTQEYYELFGDPTYQPYSKAPLTMQVQREGELMAGHTFRVKAVPNAVVCLSEGRHIWAVAATNSRGYATLKISKNATPGKATLYVSAPGYTDWSDETIQIAANDDHEDKLPGQVKPLRPLLTGSDVIDYTSARISTEWKNETLTGKTGAVYATCLASSDKTECIWMRNDYKPCGIVTTKPGGYVRKVSIDWLQELGPSDTISVFVSDKPYTSSSDVWDDSKKGTLIGQFAKGGTSTLVVAPNYTYVALRAENPACLLKSITIGWGTETFDVEQDDIQPSDFDFDYYKRHRVLIDKFTGQGCPACYTHDVTLGGYIEEHDLEDKIYELRNYSFNNDQMCMPDLHHAFARGWNPSSYPSYLVDRCGYQGNQMERGSDYMTLATSIKNQDRVADRFGRPCQVSLSLDGSTYNPATGELNVVVSGKLRDINLPDPRINIVVAQNGIVAYQSTPNGRISDYVHNGVSRACLTESVFGDVFDIKPDGTFQVERQYYLPAKIGGVVTNAQNMDVVAFVSSWGDYNAYDKDYKNSEVHNTIAASFASLPFYAKAPVLSGSTTGCQEMLTPALHTSAPIYNIQGQQIRQLQRGVNIVGGRRVLR